MKTEHLRMILIAICFIAAMASLGYTEGVRLSAKNCVVISK
jgi:hypothetical protein